MLLIGLLVFTGHNHCGGYRVIGDCCVNPFVLSTITTIITMSNKAGGQCPILCWSFMACELPSIFWMAAYDTQIVGLFLLFLLVINYFVMPFAHYQPFSTNLNQPQPILHKLHPHPSSATFSTSTEVPHPPQRGARRAEDADAHAAGGAEASAWDEKIRKCIKI